VTSAPRLLLALLAVYLAGSALFVAVTIDGQPRPALGGGDLGFFYGAGKLIVSGDRDQLYRQNVEREIDPEARRAVSNIYNPPLFALMYTPLTVFERDDARYVAAGVMVAAAVGIAWLCRAWSGGSWTAAALGGLAIASFWPAVDSIRLMHPSLLLALISGLALLATDRGRARAAGVLVALLALKPSFVLAPAGLTLWRGDRRTITWLIGAGAVLILLPFFFVAPDAILDYSRLVSGSREDAFSLRGEITAGALWMFNWNGFLGRLLDADPAPALVFPFYLISALLMVKVWARNDLYESWLAGAVTTALVIPHFLYYDMTLALPAALALACKRPSVLLIGLLVTVHLAANASVYQIAGETEASFINFDPALILATPALLLLLAYLAFRPEVEALIRPSRREETAAARS
jgi:hypothetical protein